MSNSMYENANLIGSYVSRKIMRLQSALLSPGSGSSDARGALARLRRLDKPSGGAWASAGSELFSGLPDMGGSKTDDEHMLKTVKAALKLYALHQQSKQKPMALNGKDVSGDDKATRRSFGWSCRQIEPDIDSSAGVVRRLVSLESAREFAGVENCLRGLVQLMRSKDVPVDYFQLARDLYLLQFDSCRDGVFMRWSRDYYRTYAVHDESASDVKTPEKGEN